MSSAHGEEGGAVPPAQRSTWTSFIKSIASVSGDLSSLTAPPFILSPVSLTEFPAYWNERPELFADIAGGKTPEARAELVLKWFLATLKGQYMSRNETMGSEKKPLNPVLGEIFRGHWPDKNGRGKSVLLVEQVSHHPPITAYWIRNATKGLTLQGFSGQKTSFSAGSIIVKQVGHAMLTIELPSGGKEQYLITLPKLRIDGLWYGSPYVELTESSHIQSSTGWLATIEYKGKGYFSGKAHSFKATLVHNGADAKHADTEHVYEGQWSETGKKHGGADAWLDVTPPKEEVTVAPLDKMTHPFESRKLWKLVAQGIKTGDFDLAARDKTRIENEARQRRKDEQTAGTTWSLEYFDRLDNDPEYEILGKMFKANPITEEVYAYKGPEDPLA
ncbi:Oxysterol-binding protein [Auriculariales sp. MPI-PUGE-AT-0066]|nr:Oxysterol-binding protein [Auriculariales sp. MPI-PUGE-AT-0066]